MELTVVHGLANLVNFATRTRGDSLNPVFTCLPVDSIVCSQLQRVGSSGHNAVLSELRLNPAQDEGSQRVIWLWDNGNRRAIKRVVAGIDWEVTINRDVDQNMAAFTTALLSAQAKYVPHGHTGPNHETSSGSATGAAW